MSEASHIVTDKKAEKLGQIYYTPEHLWTGCKPIKLLAKESGLSKKLVTHWLSRQLLWLRHIRGPKRIDYSHFTITTPNEMHHFDLLYMPLDKLYGSTYKYILTEIDVASRYKIVRPLRMKKASEVADMVKDIYKAGPLHYPKTFQCEHGSEFKSDITKLLEGKGVEIKQATTKYHHTFTAFVESLNNSKTAMIGMKPNKSTKLEEVPLAKSQQYSEEKPLPEDGLYLYLLQFGEEHEDSKRRATDAFWSRNMYRLDRIVAGSCVLYYLKDGPERSFVSEELMLIPEDVQIPPEHVKEWQ
ncbi:uncharacterized protein LOC130657782 [Hydractinia symbiolongicarpus]|uniref:uncharacterized protein LOC130657782 n=1 Tax=Hydractinia symbiolongicarpus TaxID=13093 RepID=UPI00254B5D41|nr:uncharacterized protein LOC130657782 [Hydractinia symbiolongicarpus]